MIPTHNSFGLLLEAIRNYHRPGFYGVIFRRESTQIRNAGGLWDQSEQVFPYLSATGSRAMLSWTFPSRARIQFSHLEYEKDKLGWMGTEIAFLGFDELCHFTEGQFWYLLSRNRSTCGVRPYVRATCNPDPDSFVARLIAWWIDPETGLPIPSRAGVVRWFIRVHDEIVWGDSVKDLQAIHPKALPKSLTFIPSSIHDNPILLEKDPGYLANLHALPLVERERLLGGNWKVRATAGTVFRREWFQVVDAAPAEAKRIRYWDRAGSEVSAANHDPDWTAGVRLARASNGLYYVEDVCRFRGNPTTVEQRIKAVASQDGGHVRIGIEQDPGQAGKAEAGYHVRALAGYNVQTYTATKDKVTRAGPASAQAGAGNIKLVRGPWNEAFLTELENFPDGNHDDQADGFSGACNALTDVKPFWVA